jgi:hypothetical protein
MRLVEGCLEKRPSSEIAELSNGAHGFSLSDPEIRYTTARIEAFCGRNQVALGLLRRAVHDRFCSYPALDSDPLFSPLRRTTEFQEIRSAEIGVSSQAAQTVQSEKYLRRMCSSKGFNGWRFSEILAPMLCDTTSASWLEIGGIHLSDYFVVGNRRLLTSRLRGTDPLGAPSGLLPDRRPSDQSLHF